MFLLCIITKLTKITQLFAYMKKAKIDSKHIYLFSSKSFAPDVVAMAKEDKRFELIDMNEL